jgi:hypothetical protein
VSPRIDRVVTSGQFCLDGGCWDVDNNIWLIGDDNEVLVVDAAHTAQPIIDAVGDRTVVAVLCTHAHNDHVIVAPELAERFDAPILLHPGDEVLWKQTHPPVDYSALADDQRITVAGIEVRVIHTPGHSPGSVCSGDTLSGVAPAQRAGPIRTSRLDPLPAAHPAGADGCAHRARRRHHDRRRGAAPRGLDRPRQLSCQMGSGS